MRSIIRNTDAMNGDKSRISDILIYMSSGEFPKNEI